MPEDNFSLEELIKLFCWKLYLEPESIDLKKKWSSFIDSPNYLEIVTKVCDYLADMSKRTFALRLDLLSKSKVTQEEEEIEKLWTDVLKLCSKETSTFDHELKTQVPVWQGIVNNELKKHVVQTIKQALIEYNQSQKKSQSHQQQVNKNIDSVQKVNSPIKPWSPETHKQVVNSQIDVSVKEEVNPSIGIWKYLPIPDNEPDKYDEYISKSGTSPEGLNLIAARVRGKMHKHNGTNCDDWFEFAVSGKWTIIAVADGAGSKKLSRIGAKISCEAAVKYLSESLANHQIKEGITHSELSTGEDINEIKNILHQAMQTAYQAVEDKAKDSQDSLRYFRLLDNREAEIKDFSATLLLAVHTTIKVEENNYNLILTCQVGDGMLAAISQAGTLKLLGKPDSGDYAGQTDFLTSKNKLETSNLTQKTFHFLGNLKCLMVMTDGVADDYFPNDPGMLELYGDLVLNQIINIDKPENSEINQQLLTTNLGSINSVREVKSYFQTPVERIIDPYLANEPDKILISSVADYAKELNRAVFEVVASPALLAAGIMDEPMCEQCQNMSPAEKLKIWLDSYYRKGSFDDRTLVVIY
ncbi:protein phosphatase 2C domain-containing protein [Anabaena aphanizomenioides LEGE 00250]|uniref:Protein phosphatase 2C domain-containing protein n=1 Tax=Sphaerospermopsis aphanizomenoides LEGE 00250 TaxID=2777972 RepID=A0ABR9VG55_9CYAN|nr:PP2C family serine/threonine-protein phosphatase [Sphaerospermopsis aphanizomenoides]MBE9237475.1 protein phosphatase 2C domain-containing protein [Sphaerospermopsis aphanizomenoides LEGE 00250]